MQSNLIPHITQYIELYNNLINIPMLNLTLRELNLTLKRIKVGIKLRLFRELNLELNSTLPEKI
jgi:hypothetical protein